MESADLPHRCPKCQALVVDRRSALCTTCQAPLPQEWVMTPDQADRLHAIDQKARAEHLAALRQLSPGTDPNVPLVIRLLDSDPRGPSY